MLRRIVKEATGGFSSGGERATGKKKPLRRAPASEASGSSQDESNQREKKATRRKKDADDTNDDTPAEKEKPASSDKFKRLTKAGRKKREPLLDYEIVEAVYSAMHGKKKKHVRQQLLTLFASYDPDGAGKINEERFKKSIIKVGVQLKKSGDYGALMRCFRGPSGGNGDDTASDTGRGRKGVKKDGNAVDYMAFIDFACNVRDSEKLSAIAAKLREVIDKYNDKHDRATTTPYNVYTDLRKLDKSKKEWIPSDTFIEFLEEHEKPRFRLGTSDITTLVERFEYDYGKKELGVDYKQFAQWLQPMLHLDKKALHARVKRLVAAAQDVGGWELDEMFEAMDDDGDGQVSGEELKEALIQMGLPLTDAQIRCLVEDYDTSGDGKIQYEEFTTLFAPLSKPKSRSTKKVKKESVDEATENNLSPRDRKRKEKRTVRNTFSWGISKAFARKHASKAGKGNNRKSSNARKPPESSESSEEEKAKTTKRSKEKSRRVKSSASSESESSERVAKKKKETKPKKRTIASSSNESSPQEEVPWRKPKGSEVRKKPSRRPVLQSSSDSSPSDSEKPTRTKVSKSTTKKRKPKPDGEPSAESSVPSISKKRDARHKQSRSSQLRIHRSQSAMSARSRIESRARKSRVESSRKASTRKKRVVSKRTKTQTDLRHHGNSTSTAGSERRARKSDASTSGLDLDEVRQLQSRPRNRRSTVIRSDDVSSAYSATDSDTDDSSSGTRSDAEYIKHLKKSLRRAFDFFDLNRSSTIEKRELSHVLRALGQEFTNEELDKEMERTDLDRNGELDFHEFVRFVKRQLAQKSFLLSKQRETEIRQAFQSLDTDKNGYLDEKEFEYLVYKVLQVELSIEEQDALLDFVDTNGDGHINEDEFIAFMKAMETFHKQGVMSKKKQRHMLENLDGISRLACSAMKKLLRGAPMDLDKNLLMFFGIPTNFRPAITSFAASRALQVNTMQHVLSLPYPEAIVTLGQDPLNSVELKKESSSLLGLGRKEDVSDEAILLKQAESWQAQAIVSLKRATGIPKPFDTREQDVLKRCVHVCLYQEQDPLEQCRSRGKTNSISHKHEAKSSSAASGGTVVGNILEIPVYWIPQEEDVWEFSKKTTKESKYKFLVRTNTMNDHLYLLVEFIVHLRMADKDTGKRKKRSRRHRRASKDNDGIVTDKDGNEVREMVCSWCKIPVRTLLAKRFDPYRSQEKLWGGTAHAQVDIEHDEILRRRTGWRAITNAFKKPTPPGMGIKSVPIESLGEDIQGYVRRMPPLIIAPFISLPILMDYMIAMQESLTARYKNDSASLCEPILRILPKIIDDHEALSIFRRAFDAEMANTKTLGDRQQRFRDLVLRMWPSFLELLDRIPPSILETAVAKTGPPRRLSLLSPTSASNPSKPSQGTGGPPPPEQQERANLLQTTAQGKLRIRDVPIPAAPFHVREVAFERLI